MALKKSYASYMKRGMRDVTLSDGTIAQQMHEELIAQRDVDMHDLEEDATRKGWAYHEEMAKVPAKPTMEQEHEYLHGEGTEDMGQRMDTIGKKRADWLAATTAAQPAIDARHNDYQAAMQRWNEHANKAASAGLDPDVTPEGAYNAA